MFTTKNPLRRGLTALAVTALAAAGSIATASPASAAQYTSGHYDLVLDASCSGGVITGGEFSIEKHGDGSWSDANPSFKFVGSTGPTVGFEVEWGTGCTPTTVNVTLASGSGTGVVNANGYWGYSGTVGNQNPLPLNSGNGYHNDPSIWQVSPGSDVELAFTFTPSSGTPVTSGEVINIVG